MNTINTTATAECDRNRRKPSGLGGALADLFLAVLEVSTNNSTSKEINMIKIESSVDPIRALEMMAKIGRFVRENARDPEDVTVETSMSGEIEIKVRSSVVAEAKRDFFNEQCWAIQCDERIRDALRQPEKMF